MRRYTTLGLAGLIVVSAIALLVFTFYPAVGSATKPLNPLVETAISQPTIAVQPGIVVQSTALLTALKQKDSGMPGIGRMLGSPTAVYARLMERADADMIATGDRIGYDNSIDIKAPVWFFVLVGDGMTSGQFGTQRVPFTQMLITVDALNGSTISMTTKGSNEEVDLSTFSKVAIPAEYVPPPGESPTEIPPPTRSGPPPTMPTNLHIAYPPPGTTEQAYPAPTQP